MPIESYEIKGMGDSIQVSVEGFDILIIMGLDIMILQRGSYVLQSANINKYKPEQVEHALRELLSNYNLNLHHDALDCWVDTLMCGLNIFVFVGGGFKRKSPVNACKRKRQVML